MYKKDRKPYPSREERVVMTREKIERLEKLNASRREAIAQDEAKLEKRRQTLAKSVGRQQREEAKLEKLLGLAPKANPSEEKLLLAKLREISESTGKSVEELLEKLQES